MSGILTNKSKVGRFLGKITDYICLYILWLLVSIPVLTIGASTCAFYYAYDKAILNGAGSVWGSFWKSFKVNFWQTLGIWAIELIIWAILGINCYMAYQLSGVVMSKVAMWVIIGVSLVVFTWSLFWLPYVSHFEDKTRVVIKNCGIMMIRSFRNTLAILGVTAILFVLAYAVFPIGLFAMVAVYMALSGKIFCTTFKKYMPQEITAEKSTEDNTQE